MNRDTAGSVLVVSADEHEADELAAVISSERTAVVPTELTNVFDELVCSVYRCLVLPANVDGQRGTDIAVGINRMFPELPIVVFGTDPATVPADRDVIALDAAELITPSVVAAIEDALEGPAPSVAGREPSSMETLLLSLFNEMPDHFYAKDDQARHVMMGRGFNEPTDRLGLTDREVPELADEHGEAAFMDEMELLDGETERIDVEELLDLAATYVRTRKVPWYDADGEVQGLIGLTQDITAWKNQEHELRREHERMVKVALVTSHEFRNELQIASGRLELLDDSRHTSVIEQSLSRIASLVDTVVALSSRERQQDDCQPVWLSRLCREVWDTLESTAATLEIESDGRFVANQKSAGLLLQFLMQNALEHGGSGVTVTVGTTAEGFFVANDGAGIAASPPESVFDPGFSTTEEKTGFGLYIAQMISDDQDWSLSLTDTRDGSVQFDVENVEFDR